LKSVFDPEYVVARIGGDEFAVLVPNASRSMIEESCMKIRKAVIECNRENLPIPLSLSIGFAFPEKDSIDMYTLKKEADDKMYKEKISCRHSYSQNLVHILMRSLEDRNIINKDHSNLLQELYFKVASDCEFNINNLTEFLILTRFYDIGKVGISDQILLKPGPLTRDEEKEMQRHCEIGYRIALSTTELRPIADWILRHHEWWNGQGYPSGIKGNDIPLECRILAIIDAYAEMTTDRPNRKAMSPEAAIAEIRRRAGTQFDPVLADRFTCGMEKSWGKSAKTGS
jgi:HD-GYP domain-containing protein (c-di-GMP phosphodiesterase class II)